MAENVHCLLELVDLDVTARAEQIALLDYAVNSLVLSQELLIKLLDLEVLHCFVEMGQRIKEVPSIVKFLSSLFMALRLLNLNLLKFDHIRAEQAIPTI